LWKVFARYGRVGEVYVPNKVDRWGRRFGFTKFLEVQNVEESSKKLGDVWCGTYKLRINLSRFGRNNNQKAIVQPSKNSEEVSYKEAPANEGKSFLEVLGEGSNNRTKVSKGKEPVLMESLVKPAEATSSLPPLMLEPEPDLLHTLECSFVGKLVHGKNIKMIQLNLCMEGLQFIRVASMGDGWVLVFSDSGEDVQKPISNKVWWDGLLEDLRPWTP
ncbi:endonuclease/exonuclease/phosphatase family protein, partial [Trifolium medium]|nr:endonuclease/exonuclease/phosphatase family protein [Trifolium medium]